MFRITASSTWVIDLTDEHSLEACLPNLMMGSLISGWTKKDNSSSNKTLSVHKLDMNDCKCGRQCRRLLSCTFEFYKFKNPDKQGRNLYSFIQMYENNLSVYSKSFLFFIILFICIFTINTQIHANFAYSHLFHFCSSKTKLLHQYKA